MRIKPRSYIELLTHAGSYSDLNIPDPAVILRNNGLENISPHSHSPVFYALDYVQKKYLYIDPACKPLLGYDGKEFMETGPDSYTRLWHQSDYKIFNERMFPEMMLFLQTQPLNLIQDLSFSFNYRIATKAGSYLSVLQRSSYYLAASDKTPLVAVGFIVDISHFKEDSKMVFTIERIDRNNRTLPKETLHKAVYFPDKVTGVLSKREVQVLQCIHDGMSSKQIADKLFVSFNTVNNHRKNMLEKTHSKNTADLLHYATKHGIL